MILVLLLGVSFGLVSAGVEYLPYEMTLQWNISDNLVYFNLSIAIVQVTYIDWWGIGLKTMDASSDMINADIVLVTKAGFLSDMWATNNTAPGLDTGYGGRNSLTYLYASVVDDYYLTSWYRELDTGDAYDQVLQPGTLYKVLWAVGRLDSNGSLAQHSTGKRGVNALTFTNDYVDDGSDDLLLLTNSTAQGLPSLGFACACLLSWVFYG